MPIWTRWGEVLVDADTSGKRVFQSIVLPKNSVLDRVRTEFEYYNDPNFTSIHLKLYSGTNATPGKLIATSDSRTKTEIDVLMTEVYGRFETYFDFSTPVALRAGVEYFLVVNGVWSSFTDSSHLRWNKGHPDDSRGSNSTKTIASGPFRYELIGSVF